jgi:YHS domain-containing protein
MEEIATDPVCGMKVKVATAKHVARHAGHIHYFSRPGTQTTITAEPHQ